MMPLDTTAGSWKHSDLPPPCKVGRITLWEDCRQMEARCMFAALPPLAALRPSRLLLLSSFFPLTLLTPPASGHPFGPSPHDPLPPLSPPPTQHSLWA